MIVRATARVVVLAVLLISAAFPTAFAAADLQPSGQAGPQNWTVLVGGETDMRKTDYGTAGAWQLMGFYPHEITVNEGDTIVWKLNSTEFHTITFLEAGAPAPAFVIPEGAGSQRMIVNPQIAFPAGGDTYSGSGYFSSGLLQQGAAPNVQEYKLTFAKAGSYDYVCGIHPGMKGKVIVQPKGAAYPKTAAAVDAEAKAQLAADAQMTVQLGAQAKKVPPTKPGPNGTTIFVVHMGFATEMADFMQFVPGDLTIHVGDTVEWDANNGGTPHTASFVSGGKDPDLILPEPQPNGPPKLVINPAVLLPSGGNTYSGSGFFNSGFINGTMDPAPGPRTYSLTFDKEGTYPFMCILHDQMAMEGTIKVVAAGASLSSNAPTTLPVTGGAGGVNSSLVGLGAAIALAGILIWRSRTEQTPA
jgi:LPXTG-motif cell wall-anchored protein